MHRFCAATNWLGLNVVTVMYRLKLYPLLFAPMVNQITWAEHEFADHYALAKYYHRTIAFMCHTMAASTGYLSMKYWFHSNDVSFFFLLNSSKSNQRIMIYSKVGTELCWWANSGRCDFSWTRSGPIANVYWTGMAWGRSTTRHVHLWVNFWNLSMWKASQKILTNF